MILNVKILIIIILCMLFISCEKNNVRHNYQVINKETIEESLIETNINLLNKESELIDEYIKENNLDIVKTGTGLRYYIYKQGNGEFIKKGNIITLQYELSLLSGEIIYSSTTDGYKIFEVGRGGVERGLEEAVLKLRNESEAILILPSHLAHGYTGDGKKIPYMATLVYKIKVIDIK